LTARVRFGSAWVARVVAACAVAVTGLAVPAAAAPPAADPTLGHGVGNLRLYGKPVSAATTLRARTTAATTAGDTRAATPPASVDLSPYAVSAGDQGQHGACASWATAYTSAGWDSNYQRHRGQPFAPMYVYNQVNGGSDSNGTYVQDNWSVLESQGVAESSAWTHPASDYLSQPTAAERANAAPNKMASHQLLFSGQRQGDAAQSLIRTVLAGNQPVVLGIPVYGRFFSLNATENTLGVADATGPLYGYHAVTVLGYTAVGVQIENSWGTGWGRAGWATLRWDFVNQLATEAWTTTGFVTADVPTAPPVVSRVAPTVADARGGTSLTVTASRLATVDTADPAAVTLVSTADPTVRATAAVTGSTATTVTVTLSAVPADGTYRVVVSGSGGASGPNGTADVVTLLSPYAVSLGAGQVARTTGGTRVTLVGTGFGTTGAAFAANVVTASTRTATGSAPAPVTWLDDTRIQVTMPAGTAGVPVEVTVRRKGVAGAPVSVPYLPPLPVLTQVGTTRVSTAGGASVLLAVTNAETVTADFTTVTLVDVADPAVTVTAAITARTATSLTISVPAAPLDGAGKPVEGAYRIVVTGGGGEALPKPGVDRITYRAPLTGSVPAGTLASALGGTPVAITGAGYGATPADFAANAVRVLVNGAAARVTWVSDSRLTVVLPAGTPGAVPTIVVTHDTIPGAPIGTVSYAALITASSAQSGPTGGLWTTTLAGAGFTGSTGWALVDTAGNTVTTLPVVASQAELEASAGAVLVTADRAAKVKLPAAPGGRATVYRLVFTPSGYQNAVSAFTARAAIIYSDLG
jgi:papain like protease/IPT/TIG domain-containing protein